MVSEDTEVPRKQIYLQFFQFISGALQIAFSFAVDESSFAISLYFLGNNSQKNEVGTCGFAYSIQQLIGYTVIYGISSGLECLSSQAYGAKNFNLLGIYYNKTLVVQFVFLLISSTAHILSPYWLPYLNVNPEIINDAGYYLQWTVPGLFTFAYQETLRSQLHAMNVFNIQTITGIFSCVCKLFLNYFFISYMKLGILGLVLSKNLVEIPSCLLLYILAKNRGHINVFDVPFNKRSFQNWGIYLRNLVFFGFIAYIQFVNWSLNSIYSGYLQNLNEIDAQSMLSSIYVTVSCLKFGLQVSSNTFIGNSLGEGKKSKIRRYTRISLIYLIILIICVWLFYYWITPNISWIFLGNDSAKDTLINLFPIFSTGVIFDYFYYWLTGVLKGLNQQQQTSYVEFCNFVVSQISIIVLIWHFGQGIIGIWKGVLIGSIVSSVINATLYFYVKVDNEIMEVQQRMLLEIQPENQNDSTLKLNYTELKKNEFKQNL